MRPTTILIAGLLLSVAAPAAAETTYRGLDATVRACLIPMKTLKRSNIEASGLPAAILRTRLYFNRMRNGEGPGERLRRAVNQPVGSTMKVISSPSVPVYAGGGAGVRQRPASAPPVQDTTTPLVTSLRQAPDGAARLELLAAAGKPAAFDRGAMGRLLRAHRAGARTRCPIVFSTDAYKPQARNGQGTLVASGGQDVYMFIDHPRQLLKQGAIGFTLVGGQPRTANMGITAGSAVSFKLDRHGRVKGVDVVGRGDLLLMSLSSQLQRDIAAGTRTGSKADPRDLLALVNRAAPALLKRMVNKPKPAQLFGPMPDQVPFAPTGR
jgi:hypothetical protein